jgi:hypothetical protein
VLGYGLISWFLGVYRVQDTKKEQFVTNVIHVEIQRCYLYIAHHVVRAVNVIVVYRAKHNIVDSDMV